MDPFSLGMMGLTGFSDPGSFADMMSGMGISPPAPGGANQFGSVPSMFGLGDQGGGLGGILSGLGGPPATTDGWGATVTPADQGGNPTGNPLTNLAKLGMQGVKAPAPVQPIMNGGVTGGAPVHPAAAGAVSHQSNMQQALLALIAAHSNPTPRVPNLGALLHGA